MGKLAHVAAKLFSQIFVGEQTLDLYAARN